MDLRILGIIEEAGSRGRTPSKAAIEAQYLIPDVLHSISIGKPASKFSTLVFRIWIHVNNHMLCCSRSGNVPSRDAGEDNSFWPDILPLVLGDFWSGHHRCDVRAGRADAALSLIHQRTRLVNNFASVASGPGAERNGPFGEDAGRATRRVREASKRSPRGGDAQIPRDLPAPEARDRRIRNFTQNTWYSATVRPLSNWAQMNPSSTRTQFFATCSFLVFKTIKWNVTFSATFVDQLFCYDIRYTQTHFSFISQKWLRCSLSLYNFQFSVFDGLYKLKANNKHAHNNAQTSSFY